MTNEELLRIIDQASDGEWDTLDLSGNELTELPPEIGKLTKLRRLILGKWDKIKRTYVGNSLTTLPAEIGQLTSLEHTPTKSDRL